MPLPVVRLSISLRSVFRPPSRKRRLPPPRTTGQHDISFFTEDIHATVSDLKGRGVTFDDEITDQGYGLATHLTMPGGVRAQLYQPKYRKQPVPAP